MTQLHTIYSEGAKKKFRRVSGPKPKINIAPEVVMPSDIPNVSSKVVQEVKDEMVKADLKHSLEQERKLTNLIKQNKESLYTCRSVFPFDLFPDEISVDPTKVNIRTNTFFFTSHLLTIPIESITDVHVQTSPFFATLKFIERSFVENSVEVSFLKISEAQYVRKLIQGLVIASKEQVDVGKIEREQLKSQAEELGDMQTLE